MSDNIPFDIQMEIFKKGFDVKSLIRFRSVSKPWKSFIDSSEFIKSYGSRHTQPHSHILCLLDSGNFIRLVEDDIETFKVQKQESAPFVVSPLLKQYWVLKVVGACHGLLCLYGFLKGYEQPMVVIWNPSIGKSFGIAVPSYDPYTHIETNFGFRVCPVTKDPTVVKVVCAANMPCHVEVFTLSSGVWNAIPSSNLPHKSPFFMSSQVVIDRFIYWVAEEESVDDDGEATMKYVVVSFDLITTEFKVVDLPDTLTNELYSRVSVSKLRESLVVYGTINVEGAKWCGVWVMEHDSSFRKLFTIGAPVKKILGFKKNGEIIFETPTEDKTFTTLDVYNPCSQQIKNIGISGIGDSFFMGSYKESLLLLDHSDLHIYSHDS